MFCAATLEPLEDIIEEYGDVMNNTAKLAAVLRGLCAERDSTLQQLQ